MVFVRSANSKEHDWNVLSSVSVLIGDTCLWHLCLMPPCQGVSPNLIWFLFGPNIWSQTRTIRRYKPPETLGECSPKNIMHICQVTKQIYVAGLSVSIIQQLWHHSNSFTDSCVYISALMDFIDIEIISYHAPIYMYCILFTMQLLLCTM